MRAAVLALCAAMLSAPASAACFERDLSTPTGWNYNRSVSPRTFSANDEFSRAFMVATVKVLSTRDLFEDRDDPEGLTAHAYRVQPLDILKGPPLPEMTLYNQNSTARFDMDVGKTYLIFVTSAGRRSVIDSCGWSDELRAAAETLKRLPTNAAPAKPAHSGGPNRG